MRKPRRIRRVLGYFVVPTTILVTGVFVSASSYSVFNAKTQNAANSWSAGTVALQADGTSGGASGTAMFAANVSPGTQGTKCITVTSNGTTPSIVKLYGANESGTNGLDQYLTLQVRVGTGSATTGGTCPSDFAATSTVFSAAHLNTFPSGGYANGIDTTWHPTGTGNDSRVFEFTYTMDSGAPSTTQSGTAHIDFVWEAQNS